MVKITGMLQWLRYVRWFLGAVFAFYLVAPIFGTRLPDVGAASDVLFGAEEWITNHTSDPILYGFLGELFISLVSPELLGLARHLASGSENIAKLTITRALVSKSDTGLPLLSIAFSISNHGPATTFQDWELWVRPPGVRSVGIKMEGRFGLDAGGDLRTKPLETGEKRHATYETVHYALPYDAMQKSGTVFIICTLDGKDKEITAQHTFQSEKQEISHDLSTSTRPGNG